MENVKFHREIKRSWWYRTIRGATYTFRKHYLLFWLFCLSFIALWYYFCFSDYCKKNTECCQLQEQVNLINRLEKDLENCCDCNKKNSNQTSKPRENCRVHFSGLIMGGNYSSNGISKIYEEDFASEYVGEGFYPDNTLAFPKAVNTTFDGIAIDRGTRLIIFSKKNFNGSVLLDVTGPVIINNVLWKNDSRYKVVETDLYPEPLEGNYPRSVRKWSDSNMHSWSFGSCKIICNKK